MGNRKPEGQKKYKKNERSSDDIFALVYIIPQFVTLIGNIHVLIDNILPFSLRDQLQRLIHYLKEHWIRLLG